MSLTTGKITTASLEESQYADDPEAPIATGRYAIITSPGTHALLEKCISIYENVKLTPTQITECLIPTYANFEAVKAALSRLYSSPAGTTRLVIQTYDEREHLLSLPYPYDSTYYGYQSSNFRGSPILKLNLRIKPVITTLDPTQIYQLLEKYGPLSHMTTRLKDKIELPAAIFVSKQRETRTEYTKLSLSKAATTRRQNDTSRLLKKVADLHLIPDSHLYYTYAHISMACHLRFGYIPGYTFLVHDHIPRPSWEATPTLSVAPIQSFWAMSKPPDPKIFKVQSKYLDALMQRQRSNLANLKDHITTILRTSISSYTYANGGRWGHTNLNPRPSYDPSWGADPTLHNLQRASTPLLYMPLKRAFTYEFDRPLIHTLMAYPPSRTHLLESLTPLRPWVLHWRSQGDHSHFRKELYSLIRMMRQPGLPAYSPPPWTIPSSQEDPTTS